jgi:hypothetical protein
LITVLGVTSVRDSEELTTEEMISLLTEPAAAEYADRVAQLYESVERVYTATLNVGESSASAATTNTR